MSNSAVISSIGNIKHSQAGDLMTIAADTDIHTLKSVWQALENERTAFIYQNYDWVRIAYETLEKRHQPLIVHGAIGPEQSFIIPLVVSGRHLKTVRWPGGKHANICCGIYSRAFLENVDQKTMKRIISFISSQIKGPAVLQLTSQPKFIDQYPNPMRLLPSQESQHILFEVSLIQGFNWILDNGNGKRKRQLFRKQTRVSDELGGFELVSPEAPKDIKAVLDRFYENKAARFAELGIKNVFEPEEVREFVEALASHKRCDGVKLLKLYELRIGGKPRAFYGCGHIGNQTQAWVNSVTYDEFSKYSPGEMMLYLLVERLIEEGYEKFDLGVGTERYKRSWSTHSESLIEVILPLKLSTVLPVHILKFVSWVRGKLRNNETTWEVIKQLRRKKAKISNK